MATVQLYAQNYIQGIVTEEKTGASVPFADVMLIELKKPTQTDVDGKYQFQDIPNGTYTLVFRMEGFKTDTIPNLKIENKSIEVSHRLKEPKATEMEEFELVFRVEKNTASGLINELKNDASVKDGVDAKSITKNGDGKVNDVLKRVSGASIQDNRFVVIRGLSDRYNSAYINGAPLPSSESDRKAFAFDIFPSNMLDNLTITKTATPELPGEFAGGVITLNTKSPLNKDFQTLQVGTTFNTLSTFRNFQTYQGGKTDWFGVDNGARAIPQGIPSSSEMAELNAKEKADLAKKMTPSWGLQNKTAIPALNLQYGLGRNFKVGEKNAGVVLAYTYQNQFTTSKNQRQEFEEQATGVVKKSELNDSVYSQKVLNSAMANTAIEFNAKNRLSFYNLYSINSEDKLNVRKGVRELDSDPHQFEKSSNRWFTQNNLYTSQLVGNHEFKKRPIKFDWNAGLSDVKRDIPNQRRIIYQKTSLYEDDTTQEYTAIVQTNGTNPVSAGNMFWSSTKERIYSANAALTLPFETQKTSNVIKVGVFNQYRNRDFNARSFGFSRYKASGAPFNNDLLLLPEDQLFAPENLGLRADNTGGFKLDEATKVSDSYKANANLKAGFLMIDSKILNDFRVVGGLRTEAYTQRFIYRENSDTADRTIDTTVIDFLPSLNLIYSINKRMNVRLSAYKTVSRPEFRELAPFAFYNFAYDNILSGNTNLQRTVITNFDARYEYFIGNGQLFTISGFYKSFENPIELVNRAGTSGAAELYYTNVPKAVNYGIETEFRVKLDLLAANKQHPVLSNTTLYTNFALIRSKVDVSQVIGATSDNRPLQGQSPYIVNSGLQYESPNGDWSMNASYNVIGRRIFIVGNTQEPDVWEKHRHVIDLQFSKTIRENLTLKINVRDLLAQKVQFYQDLDKNGKYNSSVDNNWQQSFFGQTLSASISYTFNKKGIK